MIAAMAALDVTVNLIAETELSAARNLDEVSLTTLAAAVLEAERQSGPWEIAFVFVDDERIQALHRQFMDLDSPTDVLTFPNEPDVSVPGGDPSGGDIIISVERAGQQAAEHGHALDHELRFLAVHGLLHLCGWDDGTDAGRTAMLARGGHVLVGFDESRVAENFG